MFSRTASGTIYYGKANNPHAGLHCSYCFNVSPLTLHFYNEKEFYFRKDYYLERFTTKKHEAFPQYINLTLSFVFIKEVELSLLKNERESTVCVTEYLWQCFTCQGWYSLHLTVHPY